MQANEKEGEGPFAPLLLGVERVVLLAKPAVDDKFDREVVRAKREVVPAAQGRLLLSNMHLEVLEKVDVLAVGKGHQGADGARHGGVHEGFRAAGRQSRLLDGQGRFAEKIAA